MHPTKLLYHLYPGPLKLATNKSLRFRLLTKCWYLLIFVLSTPFYAQNTNFDFHKIPIEENGVPFNQFVAIAQDEEGFLWLSTYNELLKFNGYEVKVYRHNPADTSSLADNNVEKLF